MNQRSQRNTEATGVVRRKKQRDIGMFSRADQMRVQAALPSQLFLDHRSARESDWIEAFAVSFIDSGG